MSGGDGDEDVDGGAVVGGGVGPDVSAHVHDDAVDEGKAQAGVIAVAAALHAFFGEEGVEDLGEVVGVDADAGVGKLEHDLVALALSAERDAFFGADALGGLVGDGVLGVVEEMLERLAETEAGDGGDAAGLKVEFEGDTFLIQRGLDGIRETENLFGEVTEIAGGGAFGTGFARAGEQALGDIADAAAGLGRHAEGLEHGAGVFGGEGEFDHGAHAAGDVVEMMRDAGGEGTHRSHVAGAGEVGFEFLAAGDVAHPGHDAAEIAVGVDDATEGDADMDGIFSTLGDDGHFIEIDGALLDGALERTAGNGAVFVGDQGVEGATKSFGFAAAKHSDGSVIPGQDASSGVERNDGDAGVEDGGVVKICFNGMGMTGTDLLTYFPHPPRPPHPFTDSPALIFSYRPLLTRWVEWLGGVGRQILSLLCGGIAATGFGSLERPMGNRAVRQGMKRRHTSAFRARAWAKKYFAARGCFK